MYDNQLKLLTLIKLISFVKFESKEYESHYFAASPIVGEILFDLINKFNISTGREGVFTVDIESPFGKTITNSIKIHLENIENWREFDDETKKNVIIDLASPYIIDDTIIQNLKNIRNNSVQS